MIAVNIQKYITPYCTVHVKPVQDMCLGARIILISLAMKFYTNYMYKALVCRSTFDRDIPKRKSCVGKETRTCLRL